VAFANSPAIKVPAEVKNLVTSKLSSSTLPSLEAIAGELANAATGEQRFELLTVRAGDYLSAAQKARAEKNYAKETELLRARQRLETKAAYELNALDPATRKAVERQSRIPDL
jgi:hypothetical protein